MAVPLLDLQAQYARLREPLDAALRDVVASQRFVLGPVVDRFERAFADRIGARNAVGCASGTDALLLALRALRLEPGDEVVVPAFTFFATAGAVWNAGLRPAFADIDAGSYNLTAERIEAALGERTRAVVVVHLYGQMAPMQPILELAERRGLAVVEDVAQALGARQRIGGEWRVGGVVGDVGCFSFFPTKILGAFGDAGLVTSGDDALAERVRKLRVHGGRQMYHHEMVGTNSRLDALQAAVLEVKLPHVDAWLEARRRVAAAYDEAFEGVAEVETPRTADGNEHACNVYTIRARRRDELKRHLDERGIGNSIYYPVPLHLQECFRGLGYVAGDFPESERAAGEVISLPIYPELSTAHVEEVVGAVRDFYGAG